MRFFLYIKRTCWKAWPNTLYTMVNLRTLKQLSFKCLKGNFLLIFYAWVAYSGQVNYFCDETALFYGPCYASELGDVFCFSVWLRF